MPVYTVHGPVEAVDHPRAGTDKFVFVRDGFHVWAFLFGGLWLLYHRLWLALLGYVVVVAVLEVAMARLGIGFGVRSLVMLLIALLMGLEGASLQRWTLSRRKRRQLGIVVAPDQEAAERRFFDRWTESKSDLRPGGRPNTGDWLPPPAVQPGTISRPGTTGVIGSFPEPGVSR